VLLGGATIGEGSLVGAGSVVRQSVKAGSVVVGNPAKLVASVQDILRFWEAESIGLPWADLIAQRDGAFDPIMEPELRRLRQQHFFKNVPRRPSRSRGSSIFRTCDWSNRPFLRKCDPRAVFGSGLCDVQEIRSEASRTEYRKVASSCRNRCQSSVNKHLY
jgi:hypothetical protein